MLEEKYSLIINVSIDWNNKWSVLWQQNKLISIPYVNVNEKLTIYPNAQDAIHNYITNISEDKQKEARDVLSFFQYGQLVSIRKG